MLKPAINWTKVIFFSFSAIKKTSLVFSSSQYVKGDADDGADADPEPGMSSSLSQESDDVAEDLLEETVLNDQVQWGSKPWVFFKLWYRTRCLLAGGACS